MKLSRFITAGAIASLSASVIGIAANPANALTLESTGLVKDAHSDSYHNANHNHAFWLPGLAGGSDFIFEGGSGTYNSYTNGYFNFTGTVVSEHDANKKWDVDIWFQDSQFNGVAGKAKDKLELSSSAYEWNGGPVDPTTWQHLDLMGFEDGCTGNYCSSITGAGSFDGLDLSLTQRPGDGTYTFQKGIGANGKNVNDGFSGWFEWELDGTIDALNSYHNSYGSYYIEYDGYADYRLRDGYLQKWDYDNGGGWVTDKKWHDPNQADGYVKYAKTKGIGDINVDLESTPIPPPPPPPVAVPEPTALLGLAAVGFAWRKRKQNGNEQLEGVAIS
ncbi:MAG: PEP-CTERM sorting domain-containing protein [Cyanobacteria bacterium P01_D01_bin.73]